MNWLLGPYARVLEVFQNLTGKKPAAPERVSTDIMMYDSIDLTQVPPNVLAVAGYVNGRWPTFARIVTQFPGAKHLSIDVNGSADADCLDIESGDAVNTDAPAWFYRQKASGRRVPKFYTSLSNAQALVDYLQSRGVARSQFGLWTAHYTYKAHRCSPACGFGFKGTADATQWSDRCFNRNLDVSLVAAEFFA